MYSVQCMRCWWINQWVVCFRDLHLQPELERNAQFVSWLPPQGFRQPHLPAQIPHANVSIIFNMIQFDHVNCFPWLHKLMKFFKSPSGTRPEMDFSQHRHYFVSSYSDMESAADAFRGSRSIWTTGELPKDSITDYEIFFYNPLEISRVSFFSTGAFRVDITFMLNDQKLFSTVCIKIIPQHIYYMRQSK